jgi:hypothetical protein
MRLQPLQHIVARGENLSEIARKYGLPSWQSIYNAPCNTQLRASSPNPNKIKFGEKILIPPKAVDLARARLDRLNFIRAENDKSFKEILQEWEREYQKTKAKSKNLDAIADILLLFKDLTGLSKKAYDVMKLEGEALEVASNAFAKAFAKDNAIKMAETITKASNFTEVTGKESTTILVVKVVVQSWFDMTSPSYWGEHFSGVNIDQLNEQTKNKIISQQNATNAQLDAHIKDAENDLKEAIKQNYVLP